MKKSLSTKFMLWLLCVSILPVLILFYLYIKSLYSFYDERTRISAGSEVEKASYQINSAFQEVDELLTSLIFSQYDNKYCIQSIAGMESEDTEITDIQRLRNYREFIYICSNLIRNNRYVEGVYLFNESGYTYSYTKAKEYYLEQGYRDSSWYRTMKAEDLYQLVTFWESPNKRVAGKNILEIRPVADEKGRKTAYIAVVCSEKLFREITSDTVLDPEMLILDSKGKVLYRIMGQMELSGKELRQIRNMDNGVVSVPSGGYIFHTLDVNGWKLVSRYGVDELDELYDKNIKNLLFMLLVCTILILLSSIAINKSIIAPIVRLSTAMLEVPESEITLIPAFEKREDEIGILYHKFHLMIARINELIEEQYVNEIKLLKEKLNGLMSQINSHFLFNTLENINSLAELEGNERIARMSKSLGDMLHYSIAFEKAEETLAAEMENIQKYVRIQEIRFENDIRVISRISEPLLHCRVLKFILQPLVENAIEHGLVDEMDDWWIQIEAEKHQEKLMIRVENPGVKVCKEELERIRQQLSYEKFQEGQTQKNWMKQNQSIGLENIQRRIQLMYGRAYGMEIDARQQGGLCVTLCLPLKAEEDRCILI